MGVGRALDARGCCGCSCGRRGGGGPGWGARAEPRVVLNPRWWGLLFAPFLVRKSGIEMPFLHSASLPCKAPGAQSKVPLNINFQKREKTVHDLQM